jgi:hypothetical protein
LRRSRSYAGSAFFRWALLSLPDQVNSRSRRLFTLPGSGCLSVRNAAELAKAYGYRSIAFPLIGAGTGALKPARVEQLLLEELSSAEFSTDVRFVRFTPLR